MRNLILPEAPEASEENKRNTMHIKIGNYYLITTIVGDLIIKVIERVQGVDSNWRCKIYNKDKYDIVKIRRNAFKAHLGIDFEDALVKSPEYFI